MKKLPDFKTDEAAIKFLEDTDLSEYLSKDNLFSTGFEFLPKDKKISVRFAEMMLDTVKDVAGQQGISYQKYIRMAVEKSLQNDLSKHQDQHV